MFGAGYQEYWSPTRPRARTSLHDCAGSATPNSVAVRLDVDVKLPRSRPNAMPMVSDRFPWILIIPTTPAACCPSKTAQCVEIA
ncbi:hypothetical protein ACVWXN_004304 [Bradyrhizobium sp. i1.4.4]